MPLRNYNKLTESVCTANCFPVSGFDELVLLPIDLDDFTSTGGRRLRLFLRNDDELAVPDFADEGSAANLVLFLRAFFKKVDSGKNGIASLDILASFDATASLDILASFDATVSLNATASLEVYASSAGYTSCESNDSKILIGRDMPVKAFKVWTNIEVV